MVTVVTGRIVLRTAFAYHFGHVEDSAIDSQARFRTDFTERTVVDHYQSLYYGVQTGLIFCAVKGLYRLWPLE